MEFYLLFQICCKFFLRTIIIKIADCNHRSTHLIVHLCPPRSLTKSFHSIVCINNYTLFVSVIAMIIEDKVTEIFCVADEFCKFFDAVMA